MASTANGSAAVPLVEVEHGGAPPLPEEIYLEVTNRCNLRCRTCPQFFGMPEPAADLTLERLIAIVDQLPVVRRAVLHGIGEPLLNPQLPEMIRYLKLRGAYVLFNSNGLLLRGSKPRALIESGLDELRVSIDGATPDTYSRVRGVDGFGRVLANVARLSRLKQSLGATAPKLSLWMTGLRANVQELPGLVRAAHGAGVADVYLQRLVHSERGLALAEQSLYGRAGEAELAAVRSASELAQQLGVTLLGSGEVQPLDQLEGTDGPNAPRRSCRRPWTLTYVTANGHVLPCCIAPFTGAPYASIVLGNLRLQSLAEVWNGPRYRAWRAALRSEAEPPAACRGCGADWSL
ncbi:MAG TPA: radical SAM protein [Dehalococcoidia bacterium]|nr:radical SAM protein [Dehalococcoidia bacterium]